MAKQSAYRYEIAPVSFEYGTTPDHLLLNQLDNFSINTNNQKSRIRPGGSVDSLAWVLGRSKPTVSMSTRDLFACLGTISGLTGLCVGKGIFNVWERDVCQVWTGQGVQFQALGGGLVYPTTLAASVEDTDGANMQLMFVPFYNGSDLPLKAVAIADTSVETQPAFNTVYYMGPLYINGTQIFGAQSYNINFGLTVSASAARPGPYDTLAAITDRNPNIAITGSDLSQISSLFYGQLTDVSMYLQKGTPYGDRIAPNVAEHIKITASVSDVERTTVGGDAPADATDQMTLRPVGSLSISVASVIPTTLKTKVEKPGKEEVAKT